MDHPPLFLLGRALRAARLGNSDMRGFGTPNVVARFDRTVLAEHVQAPVETPPEELMRLLGVELAAVVALMAWDRNGRPWLTCTLRRDAARDLAHRVLAALTDEQAAALRLNDALDALSPVGDKVTAVSPASRTTAAGAFNEFERAALPHFTGAVMLRSHLNSVSPE
ncbi:hypothetical protein [Streptomyces sp. BBFR102]|uniref:hypothetical protein n=1 Tax=Streptomyces sp. BBFR102 TaxID=3448171 RepID=UPI003F534B50